MEAFRPKPSSAREKRNWYIGLLYVRQDYDEALTQIEDQLRECGGLCEYPLYVKALIMRQRGKIQDSLTLFQSATCLNPGNIANLKQVGHSLYLLGKHRAAIDVYEEARHMDTERKGGGKGGDSSDWEIWHNMGLCYMYLKQYERAIECYQKANGLGRHDATFLQVPSPPRGLALSLGRARAVLTHTPPLSLSRSRPRARAQLGKVYQLQHKYTDALKVYQDALDYSPENPELLTTIGLIYLRLNDNQRAFDYLGNSLTQDPRNAKAILAAGSIIQDNQDMDVALVKYRVAAVHTPNSAQLWNNIGMCFFGKAKYVAAVACLKRALYLDPFEWIIAYNLGLVHLNTGQNASAFHFFSASINLKSDFAASYMYLAISLARLDDFENSCSAYEKAMGMEEDHMTHLNFAITLYNFGDVARAKEEFAHFQRMFASCGSDVEHDEDVTSQASALRKVRARAPLSRRGKPPSSVCLTRACSLRRRPWGHSDRATTRFPRGSSGPR